MPEPMNKLSTDPNKHLSTPKSDKISSDKQSAMTCPECTGQAIHNSEDGEVVCKECDIVLDDERIDRGPEWRTFDDDTSEESRVGAPTTRLMHDKGLSTTIGWQDKDASGTQLSARKQAKLRRLRRWDERFRVKNAHERNLKQALGEIKRMSSALGLSSPCRETAGVLYRRAVEEDLLLGRSIEGMATACLYAAVRQHGTPRTLTTFTNVSRVEKLRIQRAYRYISRELDLQIEPVDPLQYVPQFASSLEVSDEAEYIARDLLETAKTQNIHSGKSPSGLAAAALYAATRLTNEDVTQATVSEASQVSKVTIRDRYRELLETAEKHQK